MDKKKKKKTSNTCFPKPFCIQLIIIIASLHTKYVSLCFIKLCYLFFCCYQNYNSLNIIGPCKSLSTYYIFLEKGQLSFMIEQCRLCRLLAKKQKVKINITKVLILQDHVSRNLHAALF